MANYELIALNESTPQLVAPTSSDTGTCAGNIVITLDVTGQTINATGDTSAGDSAAVGYTATEGLILTGQGSTNDVTIKNDADAAVIEIPTGTTNVTVSSGDLTVSAGDIVVGGTGHLKLQNAQQLEGFDSAGTDIALIIPADANNTMKFQTAGSAGTGGYIFEADGGTDLMTLSEGGDLTVHTGDLTVSTGDVIAQNDSGTSAPRFILHDTETVVPTNTHVVGGIDMEGSDSNNSGVGASIDFISTTIGYMSISLKTGVAGTTLTEGLSIDSSQNVSIPAGDLTVSSGFLNVGAKTELTISGGVITATQSHHTVDTEGDASSDDLDTINGGTDGDLLFLRPADSGRDIVLKHGTGNIFIGNSVDITLSITSETVMLLHAQSTWRVVQTF